MHSELVGVVFKVLLNKGNDVYIGKAVCNEKCKHGLGRGFSLFN